MIQRIPYNNSPTSVEISRVEYETSAAIILYTPNGDQKIIGFYFALQHKPIYITNNRNCKLPNEENSAYVLFCCIYGRKHSFMPVAKEVYG